MYYHEQSKILDRYCPTLKEVMSIDLYLLCFEVPRIEKMFMSSHSQSCDRLLPKSNVHWTPAKEDRQKISSIGKDVITTTIRDVTNFTERDVSLKLKCLTLQNPVTDHIKEYLTVRAFSYLITALGVASFPRSTFTSQHLCLNSY